MAENDILTLALAQRDQAILQYLLTQKVRNGVAGSEHSPSGIDWRALAIGILFLWLGLLAYLGKNLQQDVKELDQQRWRLEWAVGQIEPMRTHLTDVQRQMAITQRELILLQGEVERLRHGPPR
jgi:hypothetical protein